jgi:hypothetical protein
MKKLIAGLAIVACAMTASASSVTWGLGTGNLLDATKVDSGTAYLMYSTSSVDFGKFATMTAFDAMSLAAVGLDTTIDTFSYSSAQINNNVSVTTSTKTSANTNIGGGPKSMYIVVIDGDGKDIAYTATAVSVNVQNNTMNVNATKPTSAFTYVKAASGGGEPVPEPTSGLLMLIGAAGLALRRKRA